MKDKITFVGKKSFRSKLSALFEAIAPSILAIIAGLALGFVILLITSPSQALSGIAMIAVGGLSKGAEGIGAIFYYATPIIMTGLAVGFAFKTGLFNIGASGQFLLGAYAAIAVGVHMSFLGGIHWLVALLASALAGALWGFIPGLLKAAANVNEVITSIMCNYISMNLVNLLVKTTVFNSQKNESLPVASTAILPKLGIDRLFPYRSANGGIIIAVFFVILVWFILNRTTFGFELRACGLNPDAARYAGIRSGRSIVLSMTISGALAGIGGGLLYLAGSGKFIKVYDVIASEGFDGISVALLAMSNPIGILFTGLFIANMTVGGQNLQLLSYDREIINIISAAIIYFAAFSALFGSFIRKIKAKKAGKALHSAEAGDETDNSDNSAQTAAPEEKADE